MDCTLILGATGFLGPHLIASAFARSQELATMADPFGPPVVGVGRDTEKAPRYTSPRDGAEWIAVDLLEEGKLEALFLEVEPSHVVLAAALSRGGECEAQPELAQKSNTELASRVADLCAKGSARLVYLSTDLVFGQVDAPRGGFSEHDATGPVSVYGRSKADGEAAVLQASPGNLVLRLPLMYGDSGGRGLGASDSLLEAVDQDAKPPLFVDEYRTPMEVSNAADCVVEALHTDLQGILHLAGGQRISRHELGLGVLKAAGLDPAHVSEYVTETRSADVESSAPRPRDVSLNARKAAGFLQTPLLDVRGGLDKAMG